ARLFVRPLKAWLLPYTSNEFVIPATPSATLHKNCGKLFPRQVF
ncbi:hypothetical protein HMPREF9554_03096, partial [Treponema phagedenis F0421]